MISFQSSQHNYWGKSHNWMCGKICFGIAGENVPRFSEIMFYCFFPYDHKKTTSKLKLPCYAQKVKNICYHGDSLSLDSSWHFRPMQTHGEVIFSYFQHRSWQNLFLWLRWKTYLSLSLVFIGTLKGLGK